MRETRGGAEGERGRLYWETISMTGSPGRAQCFLSSWALDPRNASIPPRALALSLARVCLE